MEIDLTQGVSGSGIDAPQDKNQLRIITAAALVIGLGVGALRAWRSARGASSAAR